ncbi:MAG: PLP-dependent aminotransferase family protein [Verrucomicrobia bacterium]|jgi:2-aminoadipate transaminase|nr:PLP-dependent aminotransferase family protein [Verrucomicrobiota bacterium]
MGLTLSRPDLISLAAGFTDNEFLPVRETREIVRELLSNPGKGRPTLQYGVTPGDAPLRRLTAERLRRLDGMGDGSAALDPRQVLISGGSQQMLYMTTEALCDPDDIVLVEDPTYFVYLGILQSHGIRARGVQVDRDGLDLDHLSKTLEQLKRSGAIGRVKMLYVVSYFHNPTGLTMSLEKKRAALTLLRGYERAAGHPIYLLEDAAYRELRFQGEDVPSALAIRGAAGRVVYAGTYSKPFATGIRVGFGVLPEPLLTAVTRIKGNHDFGTSNLAQKILARALSGGVYDAHLERLRRRYALKSAAMLKAFETHMPSAVDWWTPDGGLYFWVRLPPGLAAGRNSRVFQEAVRAGVLYVPGELCYAADPSRPIPVNEMRVSFGGAKLADIPEGVARLGRVLTRMVRRT